MSPTTSMMIRVFAAFAVAVGGGALSALLARTHKRLCALISLGAGTLLGVAIFAILPECLEHVHLWQLLISGATGYGLFALISKYIFHVCPACAASHFDDATTRHFSKIALAMMFALSIHCCVDGLALAASRQAGQDFGHGLDWSMTMAICVHKMPEGLALGGLLLGAAFRPRRMILLVTAVESTTILGGIIGWFFLKDASAFWLGIVLAHAGGGFLYLAGHAVLGEIMKHEKTVVLVSFFSGLSIIGAMVLLFHLKG